MAQEGQCLALTQAQQVDVNCTAHRESSGPSGVDLCAEEQPRHTLYLGCLAPHPEGAPREGLDRGAMRGQAVGRARGVRVPDVQHVVVATAGQLRAAGRPLEAAHLLLVPAQRGCDVLAHPAQHASLSALNFLTSTAALNECW